MLMKSRIWCFVLLFLASTTPLSVLGQTHRGSIRGTLTDSASRPISNVTVKLIQNETNESRTTTTGDQGEFTISSLPSGPYRIEVEHTGYKKYARLVNLQVNQELRLDISLDVGPINEELVVTAPET